MSGQFRYYLKLIQIQHAPDFDKVSQTFLLNYEHKVTAVNGQGSPMN